MFLGWGGGGGGGEGGGGVCVKIIIHFSLVKGRSAENVHFVWSWCYLNPVRFLRELSKGHHRLKPFTSISVPVSCENQVYHRHPVNSFCSNGVRSLCHRPDLVILLRLWAVKLGVLDDNGGDDKQKWHAQQSLGMTTESEKSYRPRWST